MPTKDELEQQLEQAHERIAELEEQAAATERDATSTGAKRPTPQRPDYGLSEGERQALELEGVTTSPFTGEQLDAHTEGVEPTNPVARRRAERAHLETERVPNEWPVSGAPPAAGGDTDPAHHDDDAHA